MLNILNVDRIVGRHFHSSRDNKRVWKVIDVKELNHSYHFDVTLTDGFAAGLANQTIVLSRDVNTNYDGYGVNRMTGFMHLHIPFVDIVNMVELLKTFGKLC